MVVSHAKIRALRWGSMHENLQLAIVANNSRLAPHEIQHIFQSWRPRLIFLSLDSSAQDKDHSSMSQVAFNPCARCGAPATRRCSGCQSQVYCNIACQTQDWKAHKTECNDTRMTKVVDRAAHLLQKVYFMFREHAFQKNMINVGTEGFDLALHESKDRSKITRGGGIFINFPTDLISCGHERKAVLSWMASKEPSGLFLELVRSMFPGKSQSQPFPFVSPIHVLPFTPD